MGAERTRARLPLRARVRRGSPTLWLLQALWFAAASPLSGQERPLEITFLDVGQGDAIVVRAPGGEVVMVDAGPEPPLRHLSRMGVDSIALLVATSPHPDHIGGADGVLTARPVAAFLDDGRSYESGLHRTLAATIERVSGVARLRARAQTLQVGALEVEVLPLFAVRLGVRPPSVGLLLRHGDFSALLPGDAAEPQLDAWVHAGAVPDVTLLEASRHGGEDGFTFPFVEAARPEIVVVSVGRENDRGHPRPEALTAYRSTARQVLRTDLSGHIRVRGFADGRYEVLVGPELESLEPVGEREGNVGASVRVPAGSEPGAVVPEGAAPGSEARPHGSGALAVRVVVDAPGWRPGDLNRDFVEIRNRSDETVELSGWRLCDLSTRCFRFPDGASVAPGRLVVVYTGYGMPDGASFFMNNDRRVWNEDGDEATLYDEDGAPVIRHVY